MKFFKSTGFLFVLVGAVVAYAYFFEYKGGAAKKEAEEKSKVIIPETLDKVTEFTIINNDGKFVFKKTPVADKKNPFKWQITEPLKDEANFGVIQGFLSQFGAEKYIEVIADGSEKIDYGIYGLEPGKDKTSQLLLTFPDQSFKVEVGTAAAMSGRRYIRINDQNRVLLANYTWEFMLHKKINDLREKGLVPVDAELTAFSIHNSKGTLHFANENSHWVLKDLKTDDPDTGAIEELFNQLLALRASDILNDTKDPKVLKETGLTTPTLEITLTTKNNGDIKISFAKNKENKIFAMATNRSCIFNISDDVFKTYDKDTQDFRDKRKPLSFELTKVNEIDYKSDMVSFKIKKENGTWKNVDDKSKQLVNPAKANDLLNKLTSLKVKKYFDQGVDYQKSGMQILTLRGGDNKPLLNLQWSTKAQKDIFVAKSQLSDKLFGLNTKDIEDLPLQNVVKQPAEKK